VFRIQSLALLTLATVAIASAQPRVGGLLNCALSTISGGYGYAISGYLTASGGIAFADYGTLVADGSGSLAGNSTESTGGSVAARTISGSYQVNGNCTGSSTLRDSLGNILTLSFTVVDNGNVIQFIEIDNGTAISGSAQRLASGCDSSIFSGPYTYAISGWLASGQYQPFADAGRIVADGSGHLTGKSTYSSFGSIGRRTFSGNYSIGSNCSGTATLSDSLGNTSTLSITVISNGQEVLFIQTDAGTVISGTAQRGQFACTNAALAGTYSYSIEGFIIGSSGAVPTADSGLLIADGNGNFHGADAISEGGSVNVRTISGSYSIGSDCSGNAIFTDTLGDRLGLDIFIADGGNQVEFVQTDPQTVISGSGEKQSGGTCGTATLNGVYGYAIEGWLVSSGFVPYADAGQLTANGVGSFSGASTTSDGGKIIFRNLTGTYQVNSDCSGTAVLRDNLGDVGNLRFVASPDGQNVVFIETDSGSVISGGAQREAPPASNAIVNAASNLPGAVVPGSLFSIYGNGLAVGVSSANSATWPTQLGGTSVTVNGKAIPLYFVSPSQINAQLPVETQPGQAQLVVSIGNSNSSAVNFAVSISGPGIFTYGSMRAVAVNTDGSVNGPPSHPARGGDTLVVYLTGAGPVKPSGAWQDGLPSPSGLSPVSLPFAATIGGEPAGIVYLGLTPASIGLYQLNVTVPQSLPTGDNTLILTVNGAASNSALISIQP